MTKMKKVWTLLRIFRIKSAQCRKCVTEMDEGRLQLKLGRLSMEMHRAGYQRGSSCAARYFSDGFTHTPRKVTGYAEFGPHPLCMHDADQMCSRVDDLTL